jgi:peroxiredoxin
MVRTIDSAQQPVSDQESRENTSLKLHNLFLVSNLFVTDCSSYHVPQYHESSADVVLPNGCSYDRNKILFFQASLFTEV